MQNAALSGLEVSQNSFARVVKNSIRQNQSHGVLVLGSASVHFGVMQTGDRVSQPNVVENNGAMGSWSCGPLPPASLAIRSAAIGAMA